jgi:hypothetical protein
MQDEVAVETTFLASLVESELIPHLPHEPPFIVLSPTFKTNERYIIWRSIIPAFPPLKADIGTMLVPVDMHVDLGRSPIIADTSFYSWIPIFHFRAGRNVRRSFFIHHVGARYLQHM